MSIRIKLFLCFLSLSMLTFVVGMIFYMQLKNLIQPLTLQSIPQITQKTGGQLDELQQYHINNATLTQLINSDHVEPILLNEITTLNLATKNTTRILQNSLNTTLIIFIDAIILSLALAFFSTRIISRPINLLRNDIEKMSEKNLYAPSSYLLKFPGEIGDLARSFASLITKLRTTTVLHDELLMEIERRKAFENKLKTTAMRLQETNLELDQFAYIASHDLRAPLRAIDNLVQWIESDCEKILPKESREHLALLKRRVKRLDKLINGILEYSRAGRITTNPELTDFNKLLADVVDNLSPPPHITIIIDCPLPTISANKCSVAQVFQNLISNAIKYHDKQQGHIFIGCKSENNHYQFYIKDDGPGISSQFHEKIFNLFQSLHSHDLIESTGLGLAIVKKIVEKQGGRIWLTSTIDIGTTFYFTWPKQPHEPNSVF